MPVTGPGSAVPEPAQVVQCPSHVQRQVLTNTTVVLLVL